MVEKSHCSLCPKEIFLVTDGGVDKYLERTGKDGNENLTNISQRCCDYINGDGTAIWTNVGDVSFCKAEICGLISWSIPSVRCFGSLCIPTNSSVSKECCVNPFYWDASIDTCYQCNPNTYYNEETNLYLNSGDVNTTITSERCCGFAGGVWVNGECIKEGCGNYERYIDSVQLGLHFEKTSPNYRPIFNYLSNLDFHINTEGVNDTGSGTQNNFNKTSTFTFITKSTGFSGWDGIISDTNGEVTEYGVNDSVGNFCGDYAPSQWILKPTNWTGSFHLWRASQQFRDYYDDNNHGVNLSSEYAVYELTIKDLDCNYTTTYRLNIGDVPQQYFLPEQTRNITLSEVGCLVGDTSSYGAFREHIKFGLVSEGPSL